MKNTKENEDENFKEKSANNMSEMSESSPKDDWDEQLFRWILELEDLARIAPTSAGEDHVLKGLLDLPNEHEKEATGDGLRVG